MNRNLCALVLTCVATALFVPATASADLPRPTPEPEPDEVPEKIIVQETREGEPEEDAKEDEAKAGPEKKEEKKAEPEKKEEKKAEPEKKGCSVSASDPAWSTTGIAFGLAVLAGLRLRRRD